MSLDLFDNGERSWKTDRTIWEVAIAVSMMTMLMTTMSMERFRQRQRHRRPRAVLVLSLVRLRLTYPMKNAGDHMHTICHHRFEIETTGRDIGIDVDAHECRRLPLWILLMPKLIWSDSGVLVRWTLLLLSSTMAEANTKNKSPSWCSFLECLDGWMGHSIWASLYGYLTI